MRSRFEARPVEARRDVYNEDKRAEDVFTHLIKSDVESESRRRISLERSWKKYRQDPTATNEQSPPTTIGKQVM